MEFWHAPEDPTFALNSAPADGDSPNVPAEESVSWQDVEEVPGEPDRPVVKSKVLDDEKPMNLTPSPVVQGGDGGIRGVRPPVLSPSPVISHLSPPPGRQMLTPPPSMSITAIDSGGSTGDILRSFAPDAEHNDLGAEGRRRRSFNLEEVEEEEASPAGGEVAGGELRLGKTSEDFPGISSYSTMNDDDASSTTTETMFTIAPNGKFKRTIRSWKRGALLGSGSFGRVYEGISE